MAIRIQRREFITLLAVATVAWPGTSPAQPARMRRIGVLMNTGTDDPEGQARLAAFLQGLQEAGWAVGRNARIDIRWGAGDAGRYRAYAAELIALKPDIILASNTSTVRALRQATSVTPIVFASATDPVGGGLVASLAHPGGNITGFSAFEFSMSGKWLELLKEFMPSVTRVAVIRDSTTTGGVAQLATIQAVASSFGTELSPIDVHEAGEIERALSEFARGSNNGLIVVSTALASLHRDLIIKLAARNRLPAVYPFHYFVADGGLMSYGPNLLDQYRRAASYVDRILKGEKPADLPVQAPTKYELVINLKTAKALGLTFPPTLLATADEVIE